MSYKDMLNTFIKLLQDNSLYLNDEIRKVPTTCCTNLTIDVLNFDLIKDHFNTTLGLTQNDKLKSVDLLKIIPSINKILLIEMKEYDKTGLQSVTEFLIERTKTLRGKIYDSLLIILGIVGYYSIDSNFYKYFFSISSCAIRPIFISNISNKDFVISNIASLPEFNISIISRRIDSNIAFYNCEMFYNAITKNTI